MSADHKVNILLVDDQPAKLVSYEVILAELGENLIKANNATEALEILLKNEVAVLLVDVCMPDLDGFQLAAMVREHPRFEKTSIIFISAIQFTDEDRVRGYEMGGVDYVPVPVVPAVLRAKVKVFTDLYRSAYQLEQLNRGLENRVAERTQELEMLNKKLLWTEQQRGLALAAGQMGSWSLDCSSKQLVFDAGQFNIFGIDPEEFDLTVSQVEKLILPEDWISIVNSSKKFSADNQSQQINFRLRRANGELRWCVGTVVASLNDEGRVTSMSGVTLDVTDRKKAEEFQLLLAREVDHRARNMLAVVQSILSLTRSQTIEEFKKAVEGRIRALSSAHLLISQSRWQGADLRKLVDEEFAPYTSLDEKRIFKNGEPIVLEPSIAQTLAMVLHELVTNAVKYGALSADSGTVNLTWKCEGNSLLMEWVERGGPNVSKPTRKGYGTKVISTSIERQLNGKVEFEWLDSGLRCDLLIPLNRPAISDTFDSQKTVVPELCQLDIPKGSQILLVEDEALVAIMMEQLLSDIGFSVLTASTVEEALLLLNQTEVSVGILDVHLGEEDSYPIADYLQRHNIPFLFVTGFGKESIHSRFASAHALQKPINVEKLLEAFKQLPASRSERNQKVTAFN